jgi:hypothetical protein
LLIVAREADPQLESAERLRAIVPRGQATRAEAEHKLHIVGHHIGDDGNAYVLARCVSLGDAQDGGQGVSDLLAFDRLNAV